MLAPGRHVGEGGGGTGDGCFIAKQRVLPRKSLLLADLRFAERVIERGHEL